MRCSDNPNRIVPGVFTATIKTEAQFQSTAFSFQHTTSVNRSATPGDTGTLSVFSTNHLGLQHEPIFSSNDFKCCAPLGSTVTDQTRCCSGFGVENGESAGLSSPKICSLPGGTNLHVYFNRFVSNEGRGTDRPVGGLLETDFDNQTGEPLVISAVTDKIRTLGVAFCESRRVRQGGAFGWFNPEPSPSANSANKIYNIVDSTRDSGQNSSAGATANTGYDVFADGFRWNHHLYCEE
jgi:hypothetical protein